MEYKREVFEMFTDLMHDIQSTFTERFLKIQVSAERPEPARAPDPHRCPRVAKHDPAPTSGADDLFMGPAPGRHLRPAEDGPRRSTARSVRWVARRARCRKSGAQQPLFLRIGEEVQEVPRGGTLGPAHPAITRRTPEIFRPLPDPVKAENPPIRTAQTALSPASDISTAAGNVPGSTLRVRWRRR